MLGKIARNIYINILYILPKRMAHKFLYYKFLGKKLNFNNVHDFNEKIQYLIVNYYGKKESLLADKNLVKKYINSLNIKDLFIPKTIKIYKNAEEIDMAELPDKFVLKCNHGSGSVFICTDKEKFDMQLAKKKLNKQLKKDFSKTTLEYHYHYIKPEIIAEEYIEDKYGKNPVDYKFYIFNGKCDRILVCSERETGLKLTNFDTEWNILDDVVDDMKSNQTIEKPKNLNKMISISEKLVRGQNECVFLPFCRVDLYNINGKIFFGEYTFTPAGGLITYYNKKCLEELGEKIDINLYKNN